MLDTCGRTIIGWIRDTNRWPLEPICWLNDDFICYHFIVSHHFIVSIFISYICEGNIQLNSTKIPKVHNYAVWFQLWPNWKLFRWFQNFRIDSKMIQRFQRLFSDFLQTAKFEIIQKFVFQIQSNSKKFRKIPIVSGYSKRFEVYSRKFQRVRRVFIRVIYVSYAAYDMLHYEMHMIYIIQVG